MMPKQQDTGHFAEGAERRLLVGLALGIASGT
jgi:hypothetical protein